MYPKFIKRLFDLLLATAAFLVLLPVILLTALILWLANKENPFFVQSRPGKSGRIFKVLKLRSMSSKRDAQGVLLPDEQRLTTAGKLVRSLSLDELPQLINVIKGDMSLVGPRPLFTRYLPLYSPEQARRHEVRPGITGLAQVSGRNAISWEERLALDVRYVDNVSFAMDIKIMLMTVKKVFLREGINSRTAATMEEFKGNGQQVNTLER